MTATLSRDETWVQPVIVHKNRNRLLSVLSVLVLVFGIGSLAGGIFGAFYTYNQAVAENITTPDDASIPATPVRGPFTMLSQKDIITIHQLENTDGLRYAEMPRQVPQVDDAGNPVLDEDGQQVMVANAARAGWITATTLTTALSVGIIAYAFSFFAIVVGLALTACGVVFLALRKPARA